MGRHSSFTFRRFVMASCPQSPLYCRPSSQFPLLSPRFASPFVVMLEGRTGCPCRFTARAKGGAGQGSCAVHCSHGQLPFLFFLICARFCCSRNSYKAGDRNIRGKSARKSHDFPGIKHLQILGNLTRRGLKIIAKEKFRRSLMPKQSRFSAIFAVCIPIARYPGTRVLLIHDETDAPGSALHGYPINSSIFHPTEIPPLSRAFALKPKALKTGWY
eukprot:3813751-Rhodomonas_salina.2